MAIHCCSGEMRQSDNSIQPCAIKRVPYSTEREKEKARVELAALQVALGLPNLVQCLGVFRRRKPACLVIVTECALVLLAACASLTSVFAGLVSGLQSTPRVLLDGAALTQQQFACL